MSADKPIDVDPFRRAAGEKMFARGEAYHLDGLVDLFGVDGDRIVARVFGSETYLVEIRSRGRGHAGTCTCPAFDDYGVCKHVIATALTYNELTASGRVAIGSRFAGIRDRLARMSREALTELVLQLAVREAQWCRIRGSACATRVVPVVG